MTRPRISPEPRPVNGQTRSKYYSNRPAMNLTPRGVTGSGLGGYLSPGYSYDCVEMY